MLDPFFDERAGQAVLGLMTLTYVPPFFDILPMYLVILVMVPVVMAIERLAGARAAMVAVLATWLAASFGVFDLPRAPWSAETWFFNPFSWQLLFFTGFAFMRGGLPAPRADRRLIAVAAVYLALCLPLEWEPALVAFPVLMDVREALGLLIDKTHVGALRYLHFLALAYLSYVAVGEGGRRLKGFAVRLVCEVGQQSLAIFLTGLVLSFTASVLLNVIGRDVVTVPLVNLGGLALLVVTAYVVAWFKAAPWAGKKRGEAAAGNVPERWPSRQSANTVRAAPAE
jgi:hypothetical protein